MVRIFSKDMAALEELAPLVYERMEEGVSVNLYTASEGSVTLPATGAVKITQQTDCPLNETITLTVKPIKRATFPLFLRVPSRAERASLSINGQRGTETLVPGSFLKLTREWKPGDQVVLNFPVQVRVHKQSNVTHEKTTEVVRLAYIAMTRGPLVYATGLIDGYKREDTRLAPKQNLEKLFSSTATPAGFKGPAFNLSLPDRSPITFVPYYEAGGRSDGRWRLTWMPVAWR